MGQFHSVLCLRTIAAACSVRVKVFLLKRLRDRIRPFRVYWHPRLFQVQQLSWTEY